MDDAASAAASANLRTTKLHREDAVAFEAHVADQHLIAGELLLRRCLDDRRTGASTKQQRSRVALGIASDQQDFLSLLGHHVRQIGEREALADPALAVDRDNLGGLFRLGRNRIRLDRRFFTQQMGGRRGEFRGGQESLAEAHEAHSSPGPS